MSPRLFWKWKHAVHVYVFHGSQEKRLRIYYTTLTAPRIPRKRRLSSSCLSVCLSVYHRGFHWTELREILCWGITWNSSEELQILLESYRNMVQFTYLKTQVVLLFPATHKHFCVKICPYFWQWNVVRHTDNTLLCFQYNNNYANVPRYYVVRSCLLYCKRERVCLLRGTNWTFKYNFELISVFKGLIIFSWSLSLFLLKHKNPGVFFYLRHVREMDAWAEYRIF